MQNQDDEAQFNDDVYEDVLDDNFEDDFEDDEDYLDVELGDEDETGFYEDFEDGEEEWGAGEEGFEEDQPAIGQKKKSKFNFNMSLNSMAITAAVVIGLGVLIFQVITTKPEMSLERFTSALNMSGANDGPVFGEEEVIEETKEIASVEGATQEETQGFLYDPDILNSMEMEIEVEDTPPMPSTITAEEDNIVDKSMTPQSNGGAHKVPRPPEDGASDIDAELAELMEATKTAEEEPSDEEFLKTTIEKRPNKKEPILDKVPEVENPVINIPPLEEKVAEKREVETPPPVQKIEVRELVEPKTSPQQQAEVKGAQIETIDNNKDIEIKLNMVLERLEDMELQITQIRETGNSRIENINDNLKILKQEMGSINSAPPAKTAPKASEPKKVVAATKKKITSAKRKAVSTDSVVWELRAAQPGKAWVSKKGQKDMQPVVIGDNLSGVGRITAISYSGNRWIVQGTTGRILQ